MNLTDLIPTTDQLASVEGIERKLLERRHASILSAVSAILLAAVQIVLLLANKLSLPAIKLSWHGIGTFVQAPEGLLLVGAFLAASIFLIVRYTGFLFKEFNEPFRYTFSIKAFDDVTAIPRTLFLLAKDHQLKLLRFDLMERLNRRIRRLSLLEDTPQQADESVKTGDLDLRAHIQIEGDYAIREEDDDNTWILHIWPRVRIGPQSKPFDFAFPVRFVLEDVLEDEPEPTKKVQDQAQQARVLKVEQYEHLIERVYSSVATEIYKQIQTDVDSKMHLFPTLSLRALARFNEARDFEESNTVDAYDRALELYRSSRDALDGSLWHRFKSSLTKWPWLSSLGWFWRPALRVEAKTRLGYSRCLIYRRLISELSGRKGNPLFEIRQQMKRARYLLEKCYDSVIPHKEQKFAFSRPHKEHGDIANLVEGRDRPDVAAGRPVPLTQRSPGEKNAAEGGDGEPYKALIATLSFPSNSPLPPWHRRRKEVYEALREELCETYAVSALGHLQLGDNQNASHFLSTAEALGTNRDANRTLVLLAKAEIEPILSQSKVYLNRAKEFSPESEIVLYRLAVLSDCSARDRDAVTRETVPYLASNYGAVLKVNPGNIASLIRRGYLYWLVADLDKADKAFKAGIELQKIVSQTFVGDLQYGLARVAAERAANLLLKETASAPDPASEEAHMQEELSHATLLLDQAVRAYQEAIAADPAVAAGYLASTNVLNSYYERSWKGMVERYKNVARLVAKARERADVINQKAEREIISIEALETVLSYALNDYGNACQNYYLRYEFESNQITHFDDAVSQLEQAVCRKCRNIVASYNLAVVYSWRQGTSKADPDDGDNIVTRLSEVVEQFPGWLEPVRTECIWRLDLLQKGISDLQSEINRARQEPNNGEWHGAEALSKIGSDKNESPFLPGGGTQGPQPRTVSFYDPGKEDVGAQNNKLKLLQDERFQKLKQFLEMIVQDNHLRPLKKYLLPVTLEDLDELGNLLEQRYKDFTEICWRKEDEDLAPLNNWLEKRHKNLVHICWRIWWRNDKGLDELRNWFDELANNPDNTWWPIWWRKETKDLDNVKTWLENRDRNLAHVWWRIWWRKKDIVIDWSRFGEEEALALAAWAQPLARIEDQPLLIAASRLICKHFLTVYYTNYFDILSTFMPLTKDDNELSDLRETVSGLLNWSGRSDPSSRFYSSRILDLCRSYEPSNGKVKKDFDSAVEAYGKARAACEKLARFHSELSRLLRRQQSLGQQSDSNAGGYREALKEAEFARDKDPQNANYLKDVASLKSRQWVYEQGAERGLSAVIFTYLIQVEVATKSLEELAISKALPQGLGEEIRKLREKLKNETGVTLPGINFRDNSLLEKGQYRCMVRDMPLPPKTLGSGPQSEKWQSLTKELERVAREHMADFYGLQDVATTLSKLELQECNRTKIAEYREIQENPESLAALTIVLKGLLSEQVPLTKFGQIVGKFSSCRSLGMPLVRIGEEIRSLPDIRVHLPSNRPSTRLLVRLAPETEAQVSVCVDRTWAEPVLDRCQEIETHLTSSGDQLLKMADGKGAAFVTSEAIRPFVRRLADIRVPVLSSREVLPILIPKIVDELVFKQDSSDAETAR
jgi:hypothetical protein